MYMRHRRLLAGAGLVVLGAGTGWLLTRGDKALVIATVLVLTVAVLALAVQVFGVPWRNEAVDQARLAAAARDLAREVRKRESTEQNKFLADSGEGKAANVSFALTERVSWPQELVVWRSDGGGESGSLENIAGFYVGSDLYPGLDHGRMVVLGSPGAGKTVLANQLLLDLIGQMPDRGPQPGTRVPVRLSLPAFDPGANHEHVPSSTVSSRIDIWVTRHLIDAFGLPLVLANALVEEGWILPILDGLDEMDPDGGGTPRAAAVARALNSPVGEGLRRVVVTCRKDRYEQLAAAAAEPGQEAVLQDATVIELEPLNPSQVAAYLAKRFPDPAHPVKVQQRWQSVLDQLEAGGALASALGSPLRLFMVVASYHRRDTQPSDLIGLSGNELDGYLFDRFIPAVTFQYSRFGNVYNPGDVNRWLTTLARHLETQQRLYGGSGSDLDLHKLWTAAGYRAPRYITGALRGLISGIPLLFAAGLYIHQTGHLLAPDLRGRIAVVSSVAIVCYIIWRAGTARGTARVKLHRLDPSRLRIRAGRRQLSSWVVMVLGVGVIIGLARVISSGHLVGKLALFFATFLVYATTAVLDRAPSAISRPSRLITQGWTYDFAIWLGAGLGFGFLAGVNYQVTNGVTFGFALGFAWGLAFGSAIDSGSPWLRYLVASQILAWRRQLPRRPAQFMDWAYSAGLLRLSGISIQFRHSELQNQLRRGSHQEKLEEDSERTRLRFKVIMRERHRVNALAREAAIEHNDRGITLVNLGRFQEALEAYAEAIRLDPTKAYLHSSRGDTLTNVGRFQEALEAYDEAIRLDPKSADHHSRRGVTLVNLGRFQEALDAYTEAIRLYPESADLHNRRGVTLENLGRLQEALDAYAEAIRLDPTKAYLHSNRGITLENLGRLQEALDAYAEAIRLDPESADLHNRRGVTLVYLGRLQEALEAFAEAIHLDPTKAYLHSNRGTTLTDLGYYQEALDAFAEAIRLDSGYYGAHEGIGEVLLLQGRNMEARTSLRRAVELDSSDAMGARVLLAALLLESDPDQSARLCRAALAGPGKGLSSFRRAELRALAHLMLGQSRLAETEIRAGAATRASCDLFERPLYDLLKNQFSSGLERLLTVWAEIDPSYQSGD